MSGQAAAVFLAGVLAANGADEPVWVAAPEARIREMGRITPEGGFSFWNDGAIGERFFARQEGKAALVFTARGVAVGGEWPLVAVELCGPASGPRELARISVDSAPPREFRREVDVPAGPFELRLRQLNRPAGADPKSLRHLLLTKFALAGCDLLQGSLLEAAFFAGGAAADGGGRRKVSTPHLEAEVFPASGIWRAADGGLGCSLGMVRPVVHAGGRTIDLSSYRAECEVDEDAGAIGGPATRVALRYRKAGGIDVDYTLWFSRQGHEVIARLDLANNTGAEAEVVRAAPAVCGAASVGAAAQSWAAVGDAKENSGAHRLIRCGELGELEAWWHVAVKNPATGRGLLAGSLRNRKGLGRFLLLRGDGRSVRLAAYSDYEGIVMPAGARIEGEPFLLCFGPTGNAVLERFGDLVAEANGIDLRKDHPLDTHTPRGLALFTSLNLWGASVVKGFPYQFDRTKGEHALMDPVWAKANRPKVRELGLDRFGYGENRAAAAIAGAPAPLARRYGEPDFWSADGARLAREHPEFYVGGRIDFSNPAVIAFERERVAKAFAQAKGTVNYSWDFTDKWRRLPGQHDPFMTSADTYRAAMGIWREAGRRHPQGAYAFVWMNVVGLHYDIADVIHIGHDSDNGYGGEGLTFTHGLARQISGRYFYNGRVWWNSPDSFHVYAGGIYSAQQAKVHASFCSIAGNLVHLGEPLGHQETPPDRVEIIRRVSPTTADVARAVDVFENNPARLWAMPVDRPFGRWMVAGLFNTDFDGRGAPVTQEIRFAEMGLDPAKEYLVYEFWSRRFLGAVRGSFTRTLAAPDCEIYAIVENHDRPVLLSTSRHLRQMAYDVRDCRWDPATRTLEGRSAVVAGDPYQLRVYVPTGFAADGARAGGAEALTASTGPILEVNFPADAAGEVAWTVRFR